MVKIDNFLKRSEKYIPLALFLVFLLVTLPGISWGAPGIWNPDELVHWVDRAIHGSTPIDEINFDYPSLPKWVMFWMGKVIYHFGYSKVDFMLAARVASVILGGLIVLLTYRLVRMIGGSIYTGMLAAGLVIASSEMAVNARFAHNDIYLAFFVTLVVFCLVYYRLSSKRGWLYGAFLGVGFAASSKYNGVSLLLAVLIILLVCERSLIRKNPLKLVGILGSGVLLTYAGFVIGTPKALLSMGFYFKGAADALVHHATYGREPGDVIGLFGQWGTMRFSLGTVVFILVLAALVYFCIKALLAALQRVEPGERRMDLIAILLLSILAANLPILVSYNYPSRFFLPMVPLFSILVALFLEELFDLARLAGYKLLQGMVVAAGLAILALSMLRATSVGLLFLNDNRIAAGQYLATLQAGKSVEYTLYPPNFPEKQFSRQFGYPIFFKKFADQALPQDKNYAFNQGEAGIEERRPKYFIVDSFTYDRFKDEYVCKNHQVECDFFRRLLAGQTNYRLIKAFDYQLPAFLPDVAPAFLNPVIQVYQRGT